MRRQTPPRWSRKYAMGTISDADLSAYESWAIIELCSAHSRHNLLRAYLVVPSKPEYQPRPLPSIDTRGTCDGVSTLHFCQLCHERNGMPYAYAISTDAARYGVPWRRCFKQWYTWEEHYFWFYACQHPLSKAAASRLISRHIFVPISHSPSMLEAIAFRSPPPLPGASTAYATLRDEADYFILLTDFDWVVELII